MFTITVNVEKNEQQVVSQIASIMKTMVQLKQQIVYLEAECALLKNLIVQLSKKMLTRDL